MGRKRVRVMNAFLWGIGAGVALILLFYLPYLLAKGNIFFTIVEEGKAKAIKQLGKFHRVVMAYKGHRLSTEWDVCGPEELGTTREVRSGDGTTELQFVPREELRPGQKLDYACITTLEPIAEKPGEFKQVMRLIPLVPEPWYQDLPLIGGLRWVGIPIIHTVHTYRFRWVSLRQGEDKEKKGELKAQIDAQDQRGTDYILLQDDIYYTLVEAAESMGMVQLDIELLLTLRIVNPYKALFRVEEWLETTINKTKPAVRQFVARHQYEELIGLVNSSRERQRDVFLQDSQLAAYLERTYGVRLKEVGFVAIEPVGKRAEKYLEAASKQWEAGKEVQRLRDVYGTIIKEYGADGLAIRFMEAIETASGKQGNWVIPFFTPQSAVELLRGGKKE